MRLIMRFTLFFQKECEREKRLQDKIESVYRYTSITLFKNKSELKNLVKKKNYQAYWKEI